MADSHTEALRHIRTALIELAAVSLFYGIYLVLWVQSTYLLSHNGFLRNTWTKRLLMIATLVMFVSATASWIEVTADVLLYLPHRIHPETKRPSSLIREHNGLVTAKDVSVRIVYILSDAMVVQRAWVLWPQNKKVKILLCGCILVTIAGSAVDLALDLKNRWDGKALVLRGSSVVFTRALIMAIPTLITNLIPTILIALKAWRYRASVRRNLSEAHSKTGLVERILILLVECGVLYCITWVMYILTTADLFPSTFNTVLSKLLILVAATYPCIIACLACLAKTHCDHQFTYSHVSFRDGHDLDNSLLDR